MFAYCQAQNVLLLETIPRKGVQENLRPKGNLKENLMEDPEERTILKFQEPQLLEGSGEPGNWEFRGVSDSSSAGKWGWGSSTDISWGKRA